MHCFTAISPTHEHHSPAAIIERATSTLAVDIVVAGAVDMVVPVTEVIGIVVMASQIRMESK
ncbi:hypothetical protein BDZ91DRAFT_718552 [Kalaharituber pfeilii]|nr:hypothetical protein BDZ91DRAFT_718552 [Kalaharituber pfeilii]